MKKSIFLFLSLALIFMNCGGDNSKKNELKKQAEEYAESMKIEEEIGAQVTAMFRCNGKGNVPAINCCC
jgi:hypothetical protein